MWQTDRQTDEYRKMYTFPLVESTWSDQGACYVVKTTLVWYKSIRFSQTYGQKQFLHFRTSGYSDAHGWASECPDVKNYKWRHNPVWHRMLYSCTHMATVGIIGLILIRSHTHAYHSVLTCFVLLGGTKAAGWRQRSRVTGTVAVDGDRTHRSVASSTHQHNINIAWPSTLLGPSLNDDDTCMSVCRHLFCAACYLLHWAQRVPLEPSSRWWLDVCVLRATPLWTQARYNLGYCWWRLVTVSPIGWYNASSEFIDSECRNSSTYALLHANTSH